MTKEPYFPKPLEIFLIIIVGFMFIMILTQSILAVSLPDPETLQQNPTLLKLLVVFSEIALIILPLIYLKKREIPLKKAFRIRPISQLSILWSFLIGLGIALIGDELDRVISVLIPAPEFIAEFAQTMRITGPLDFILLVFGTVLVAALVEESLIRGLLQQSMEEHYDVTRAVIYASLAWTIIHGMLFWAIQIFLMGIVLGLLAWRSNSLWPAVIAHGTNNALAVFFYNISNDWLESIYLWNNHVNPLFLVAAVALVVFGIKYFYKEYGRRGGIDIMM